MKLFWTGLSVGLAGAAGVLLTAAVLTPPAIGPAPREADDQSAGEVSRLTQENRDLQDKLAKARQGSPVPRKDSALDDEVRRLREELEAAKSERVSTNRALKASQDALRAKVAELEAKTAEAEELRKRAETPVGKPAPKTIFEKDAV